MDALEALLAAFGRPKAWQHTLVAFVVIFLIVGMIWSGAQPS